MISTNGSALLRAAALMVAMLFVCNATITAGSQSGRRIPKRPTTADPTPSREDVRLTRQLVECAHLLDLRVHDHVIIGRGRYTSLAERGII